MHWTRSSQYILRSAKARLGLSQGAWRDECLAGLHIPTPPQFSQALFNFTVDFELFWGNGNLDGKAHTLQQRIHSAEKQAENFYPFLEMLKEIGFPISWAVLGCLVNPFVEMVPENKFQPNWEKGNWYELPEVVKSQKKLWDGRDYLNALKAAGSQEILSHGYGHINFGDETVTKQIAWNDIMLSRQLLSDFGLEAEGFVFPCNAHAFGELLPKANFRIARGPDKNWHSTNGQTLTPIGFWISPGMCSFRELKVIINEGIARHSFIHPWMHLIECELKRRDITDFYRPLFSFILEEQAKERIRNISFREIATTLAGEL